MRFHWQNLTKERRAEKTGFPWEGRAWWHFDSEDVIRFAWLLGDRFPAIRVKFAPHDEDTVLFHIGLPPVSLWFGAGARHGSFLQRAVHAIAGGPSDVSEKFAARELAISFFEGSLHWNFWTDPNGWTNQRSKWRDGHLNFVDLLFGKPDYESHVITKRNISVPMPERAYSGELTLTEDVWRRPRGLVRRRRRAHIDMAEPIPFPGKGENSWDCGDDALHGLTTDARTVGDAIGAIVASVMNSRERHGGADWRPGA